MVDLVINFLPALKSPYGVYEGSEYQYPVVLNQTNKVASFINIEDMLFEVIKRKFVSFTHLLGIYYLLSSHSWTLFKARRLVGRMTRLLSPSSCLHWTTRA